MAVARRRDVNSGGGGSDGDGLVLLLKLSEQKNKECSADGPDVGGTVCSVSFGVSFFSSSYSGEDVGLRGPGHCGGQTFRLTALTADSFTCKCLEESASVE